MKLNFAFRINVLSILGGTLCLPILGGFFAACSPENSPVPSSFPGKWNPVGRVEIKKSGDSVTVGNGFLTSKETWGDSEFTFRAQAPAGSENVQIWGAMRVKDRENRYVVGLRGGVEPQLSFARYASDGKSKFLGWVPLDPAPAPGTWFTVRVAAVGKRFHVYLNDEKQPRINIEDKDALWETGCVALGGGWLPTEFSSPVVTPLTGTKLAEFQAVGDTVWELPQVDKAAERVKQRAMYQPAKITDLPKIRGELSLDGDWLFMPEQDLPKGLSAETVAAPGSSDAEWNVMPVPAFWTMTVGWLHGEGAMLGLSGMASSRGPADSLIAEEYARLNALTFDWNKTKSGWYRHHLEMPDDLEGRHFELVFDAISKVSEVWVNGSRVGSNIGMFKQVRCDITKFIKPGLNVIAVHDIGVPESKIQDAKKVADIAVTVEVTNEMLRSLPHGMTDNNSGGIWQPVRLEVTNPVRVTDVYIRPSLQDASIDVELSNSGSKESRVQLGWAIRDFKDQAELYQAAKAQEVRIPAGATIKVSLKTPKLQPKLWTPDQPNLYVLDLSLKDGSGVVDTNDTRFGFRTFTVADGKLLLNGKPYWLRGGNHFPVSLRPNDAVLAKRFMELAKEGNVAITRSHAIPFTTPWFDAADEIGMGVSYEGTWPWLMLNGPVPDPELIRVWKEEFASLIKRHRNHPSLFYWTVNNEMKFAILETLGDGVLKQKWTVLDDMMKTMRQLDPTRPIVVDSAYTRREADKKSKVMREANKFDDGDIDDAHRYYGWYNESPFHLFDGKFGETLSTPGRPLISQEMSTGYPRNDDWPSRSYQFSRYVPQALVGNYAFEQNDPTIFMTRQAFMTKEVAEAIRRTNRSNANGILHFAYLTWFTDVWKADKVRPKLTYYELKRALQPILVSAELYGRHFYAGETVERRVCLANDSLDCRDLPTGKLLWEIQAEDKVLASGSVPTGKVPYYENQWVNVNLAFPASLPAPRVDAKLVFKLELDGKIVSENSYDVLVAAKEWTQAKSSAQLYDPQNLSAETTEGLGLVPLDSTAALDPAKPLVIGDVKSFLGQAGNDEKLKAYVQAGGRVLLLQPGEELVKLFPDEIKSYRKTQGEIVTMSVPESIVFDGLQPLDTAWFEMGNRNLPFACSGTFEVDRGRPGVFTLALECQLHPDIPKGEYFKLAGSPIVEILRGKGLVLASEMMFSAKQRDPVAAKLLANMLQRLEAGSGDKEVSK